MMKRNEEKVPAFDEIIFENRNKMYGAYQLRRRYKTTTSLSVLGTMVICSAIVIMLSLKTEPGIAVGGTKTFVILKPENYTVPKVAQPEVKPPKELIKQIRNLKPVVVDDTSINISFIPLTDEFIHIATNGDLDTTLEYIDPQTDIVPPEPTVFTVVKEPPEFPGGDAAILEYLTKNTRYPDEAIQNNIEGRVILKFVVTSDGSVSKIEILKSVDPLLDQEAVRVVGTLPKFQPGRQNGVPVNVWFTVPVSFRLKRQ